MLPEKIHIGTSGWSYKHWADIFYPNGLKPDKYLEYYTSQFSCVELNSSFYNLPRKQTAEGWLNRTPESFFFCPKMSRHITHEKMLTGTDDAIEKFFGVFEIIKNKLGPILIQLPPGLSYDQSLISCFFDILNHHGNYRFAIEIRNKSWINDDFFELLNQKNIGFVIADSGRRYPYHEAVTSDFVYLRLHGREQLYATDYHEDELKQFANRIHEWLGENKEVWVFFNNDFHGFAVKNARQLIEMVSQ